MLPVMLRRVGMSARRAALVLRTAQRGFASYPPHEVVGLPALSPTMETGTLAKWRMKEGDKISIGDIICQVETDKAVVDYEAQDEMYLAKILVPEGADGIAVGQPIMVTTDDEENLAGLKDFKVDASAEVAAPAAPKAPEEIPPKKEEVPVDPASKAPVVPSDFLVTSQTTHKVVSGTTAPAAPAPKAAKPAAPQPSAVQFAENWGFGFKKSALSFSLTSKQQAYIDLYGITGTTPAAASKKE